MGTSEGQRYLYRSYGDYPSFLPSSTNMSKEFVKDSFKRLMGSVGLSS